MAIKLVETAVESVDSHLCSQSVKSDANLRTAQLFALNHIRCVVALDNLESSRDLFDKYMKLYPSCIELVLLLACIQKQESNVANFTGFEEAISIWPNEVPGISMLKMLFKTKELIQRKLYPVGSILVGKFRNSQIEEWMPAVTAILVALWD